MALFRPRFITSYVGKYKHFNRRTTEIQAIFDEVKNEAMRNISLLTSTTDVDIIKARIKSFHLTGLLTSKNSFTKVLRNIKTIIQG